MSFYKWKAIVMIIENIKNITEIVFFIGTIIVAFLGLNTWRIHLRGGDLFTYSKDALLELRKLIDLISSFRYIFTTSEQEIILWNKIQEQYFSYENKIIHIRILSKNKFDDKIDGENIKDILTSFMKLIYERQFLYEERKNDLSKDERKRNGERFVEIDKTLKDRNKDDDKFSIKLENYYNKLSEKLNDYL